MLFWLHSRQFYGSTVQELAYPETRKQFNYLSRSSKIGICYRGSPPLLPYRHMLARYPALQQSWGLETKLLNGMIDCFPGINSAALAAEEASLSWYSFLSSSFSLSLTSWRASHYLVMRACVLCDGCNAILDMGWEIQITTTINYKMVELLSLSHRLVELYGDILRWCVSRLFCLVIPRVLKLLESERATSLVWKPRCGQLELSRIVSRATWVTGNVPLAI